MDVKCLTEPVATLLKICDYIFVEGAGFIVGNEAAVYNFQLLGINQFANQLLLLERDFLVVASEEVNIAQCISSFRIRFKPFEYSAEYTKHLRVVLVNFFKPAGIHM